ncbi:cytochrome caa3 oxidase [Paenibacillus mucilaginosus 3016]|uniref:Cytochrome caa3 oxidase n=1 Tax=Paenibacillus mucilaginosus 3016 TaxID=1116391 RepID=H6NC23_9BACL|nr:COX15/CtaA family protein [Paenibacillus mucilaginosus]AFC28055.1 cytochrome caa3 oxidase [Paenibacillus mucilaginosus 3016]
MMNIQKRLKQLSFASMAGMFLILVMGALVTKTESGRGCGDDWPLCNGKFVPAYTIESFIEYSHRFVVGVVGLILLATTILVFLYSKRKDAKWYVGGAMLFTVLQAILGAMAVVWPQSSAVLALHFGFSLLSFAFTLLLYLVFTRFGEAMNQGGRTRLSAGIRWAVWGVLIYSYVVVYLGAFVRHTEAVGGCIGWPLCNGEVIPEMVGGTTVVFIHRVAAALLGLSILALFLFIRTQASPGSAVYRAALYSLVLVILQILSGGFVTLAIGYDIYLVASLLHAVLVSCLFGVLCYLGITSLYTAEQSKLQAYAAPRLP